MIQYPYRSLIVASQSPLKEPLIIQVFYIPSPRSWRQLSPAGRILQRRPCNSSLPWDSGCGGLGQTGPLREFRFHYLGGGENCGLSGGNTNEEHDQKHKQASRCIMHRCIHTHTQVLVQPQRLTYIHTSIHRPSQHCCWQWLPSSSLPSYCVIMLTQQHSCYYLTISVSSTQGN